MDNNVTDGSGNKIDVIMNFSLFDKEYCIYLVHGEDDSSDVCCGQIIGDRIIDIVDDGDRKLVNNIALQLANAVKGGY